MIYIIFKLLHNLFDLYQVSLSKMAKHWDSFLSNCKWSEVTDEWLEVMHKWSKVMGRWSEVTDKCA